MSLRAYSETDLHITWHVKDNHPILRDDIESQLHRFLRRKAADKTFARLGRIDPPEASGASSPLKRAGLMVEGKGRFVLTTRAKSPGLDPPPPAFGGRRRAKPHEWGCPGPKLMALSHQAKHVRIPVYGS